MKPLKTILWTAALVGAGLLGFGVMPAQARPPAKATKAATVSTNSVPSQAKHLDPKPAAAKHQLTGAQLYSMNCNRCHQERYPTERTGAQWKTLLLHMQVRANLPVKQAKLILQFLQENSGR